MAEIKQALKIPSVPNFIMIEAPTGLKQDGWQELPKVSIADLPEETLIEIADEWKEALLKHARNMRSVNNPKE